MPSCLLGHPDTETTIATFVQAWPSCRAFGDVCTVAQCGENRWPHRWSLAGMWDGSLAEQTTPPLESRSQLALEDQDSTAWNTAQPLSPLLSARAGFRRHGSGSSRAPAGRSSK